MFSASQGLSIGLAKIRDMKGFSLLVDTPGMDPDVNAARYALTTLGKYLNIRRGFVKAGGNRRRNQKNLRVIWHY